MYDKSLQPTLGCYPFLTITALLKVAKLLAEMVRFNFKELVAGGAGVPLPETVTKMMSGNVVVEAVASLGQGSTAQAAAVTKMDVSSWIMKSWATGIEFLTLQDQFFVVSRMAASYAIVSWKRKHAFFLRQIALLVLSTFKPGDMRRLSGIGRVNDEDTPIMMGEKGQGNGGLVCMKRVCDIFGVGGQTEAIEGDLDSYELNEEDFDWLDEFRNEDDLENDAPIPIPNYKFTSTAKRMKTKVKFGWPDLQIDILKECIDIAEGAEGTPSRPAVRRD